MKLIKETLHKDKSSSTLNTDSSSNEFVSKLNLQCEIKNKSTQKTMEKVDSEKQQDNTLNDTVDYNKLTAIMITISISTLTRTEKKKQKRKIKKIAKKTIKFLNSPIKDTLTVV
jgi:hypothetical protein